MKEARVYARGRSSISTLHRESGIIRGEQGIEERERERLAIDRRAAQFEFIRLIPPADSAALHACAPSPNETKLLSYRR